MARLHEMLEAEVATGRGLSLALPLQLCPRLGGVLEQDLSAAELSDPRYFAE